MKRIKLLLAILKNSIKRYFRVKAQPILSDLFTDDAHDFCLTCGELFFKQNKTHRFCTSRCRNKFHNSKR